MVLASPIWFSSLSGPLLSLASRFQTLFAARHFRQEPAGGKRKNGVILLTGAEQGTEAAPIQTALTILKHLHVERPCTMAVSYTHLIRATGQAVFGADSLLFSPRCIGDTVLLGGTCVPAELEINPEMRRCV